MIFRKASGCRIRASITGSRFLSIPFIFSIVLVIAALWIRNGMDESAEFEQQQREGSAQRR
jgi:MHS family shikimate/dehydroshikimate transporter-like MFS transporter